VGRIEPNFVNGKDTFLDDPRPLVRGRDSLHVRVSGLVLSGRYFRESVGSLVEDNLIEGGDSAGDLN
jgi:hypothetical protein